MANLTSNETIGGSATGTDFRPSMRTASALAETRSASPVVAGHAGTSPPHHNDRDAIIRALYDDRGELVDQEALGALSAPDAVRLRDLEREIDRWERSEVPPEKDEIWEQLERLAGEAMGLQAQIEQKTHSRK